MSEPWIDAEAVLRQVDANIHILVLVTGRLPDGSEHYAYASIPPSRYDAFKQAEARGNYDLAVFGAILAHGNGLNPPPEVRREMEQAYGANHRFEEELQEMTERLEQALAEQKNG